MSSTRLPGKVLLPLNGNTILEQVISRIKQAKSIGEIIVLTTEDRDDDKICELCAKIDIKFFRGSLNDVLDRYYQAADKFGVKDICRITADCPLVDPDEIDKLAEIYNKGEYDYVANNHPKASLPDGLDCEIFSHNALKRAWQGARLASEREHVTPYIWNHPEMFRNYNYLNPVDLSRYRLTVDEPADYEMLKAIFANVKELKLANIVDYIRGNPSVARLNDGIIRDSGYFQSLKND